MTRHVDAEVLGRFSAGDLSRSRSARIGAHLRSCLRCAELGQQLAGVSALLASVPAPPMPEHLATRISASLATEAARRAARETRAPGRLVPERRVRRVRRPRLGSSPAALRVLAAAGAVAVLAGGGYAIVQAMGEPATSGSATGPVRPQTPVGNALTGPAGNQNGARSAASAAGSVAVGPMLSYQTGSGPADFRPVTSSTDYTAGQLAAQVSSTLARLGHQHVPQNSPSATEPGPARFGGLLTSTIEGCVNRVAAGQQVLLVDIARYRGGPATVIVVRATAPAADHVWVAGPACSGASSDVLAEAELPR